jgi:hypothetical protein
LHSLLGRLGIAEDDARRSRKCADCGTSYSILQYLPGSEHYFSRPYDYANGCLTRCLGCWLGVGPNTDDDGDPAESSDLLRECGVWLGLNEHLIVLPLARVTVDAPIRLPVRMNLYPASCIELDVLNVMPNNQETASLAEYSSTASGVDAETILQHATVAFAFSFNWDEIMTRWSHASHMELIRYCPNMSITQMVRLEVLRELREPADVEAVRTQTAAWSRAVAGASPPH